MVWYGMVWYGMVWYGSDHRMIRGSVTINTRLERARLINRPNKANAVTLSAKAASFQLLLTNKFEALNSAPADDIGTSTTRTG